MSLPVFMGRLPKDADLLQALTAVCREHGVSRGSVQLIGALQQARLGYYNQDTQQYHIQDFPQHLEILAGLGNVSLKDGQPFVHLHLTLSNSEFGCVGGHAMEGCILFAAEAIVTRIDGPPLIRGLDEPTGLPLWKPSS